MKNLLVVFTTILSIASYSQSKLTIPQAFNIANKQAMLSQRMAKDKIHAFNNSNVSKANVELGASKRLFKQNLQSLDKTSFSKKIKKDIFMLDLLSIGYNNTLELTDKTALDLKLINHSNVILDKCNDITREILLIAKNKKKYPYNVNNNAFTEAIISVNNLRFLSQKLSLYYTAFYFRNNQYNHQTFIGIVRDIEDSINKCNKVNTLSNAITVKSDDLWYTWKLIKDTLDNSIKRQFISSNSAPSPVKIFEMTNKLLNDADKLSRAYKTKSSISQ